MPGKRKFEEQLAVLEALRDAPDHARIEPLRKALDNKSNFVAARAADLVRTFKLTQLTPELLAAFDRFFEHADKSDPQCWAKNAISGALAAFEHPDADVFLRGMRHIQMEPVWGGNSDTAGTLRATCALALVQCRSLREPELLTHLIDLLGDKDKAVRTEAVRAIEMVNSPSASLLLRARAVLGADEPEVLGACYGGILRIEGERAIPWVGRFLQPGDDAAGEAALAIAATHTMDGFHALRAALQQSLDPWFRSVLLSAIALTRQDAAMEYLFDSIAKESPDAEGAIEAIVRAMPTPEVMLRLDKLVAGSLRLSRHLATLRAPSR
ncbi:MAG: HEAT repeat domain-containing protein [Candidatus Sulfotelmatobacter sp.]